MFFSPQWLCPYALLFIVGFILFIYFEFCINLFSLGDVIQLQHRPNFSPTYHLKLKQKQNLIQNTKF